MADISSMRKEYTKKALRRNDLEDNPFKQFEKWFSQAIDAELIEPNAFTLATAGADMRPSQRVVLLKMYDEKGFVFFTNYTSKKSKQIDQNGNISAHFSWLGLERQVAIEGTIEKISKAESLKYFLSRPKGSQLGAWVSHQSQIVTSKTLLEAKFENIKQKFLKGEVPFPDFWGGYIIKPRSFEFWQGGHDRLHDRFLYSLNDDSFWEINRLEP